jgi:hypothetical protein
MTTDAAITVRAIRDGEPEALAALCAKRGAPVLAYCEHVAAPRQAGKAAANAFAQLRATIVAASETPSPIIDLEAELLASTRRAAAGLGIHAIAPAANGTVDPDAVECAGLETKLVAQIERPRSDEERQEHAEHIARCPACARAMERLESGQRAFDKPPRAPLPPRIAEQLLSALVQAAPVVALGGDAEAVREQAWQRLGNGAAASTNGSRNGSSHAISPVSIAAQPAPLAGGWDAEEPIAPRAPTRASSRRPVPAPAEASSLGALVSDAFAVTRHRMLGPRAGSVERPRHQSRILRARGSLALRPADRRRVEFAAVGIFVAVAALVTVVTFMMTSEPSNTSSAAPAAARVPAATSGATSTADAGTAAGGTTPTKPKTPAKQPHAAASSTAHHTSSGKASSSKTSSSKTKTKAKPTSTQSTSKPKQTESTPAATAAPGTPKRSTPVISAPPPPPPAPSKPSPAKSSGSSIPGGDFSTEGDTG